MNDYWMRVTVCCTMIICFSAMMIVLGYFDIFTKGQCRAAALNAGKTAVEIEGICK